MQESNHSGARRRGGVRWTIAGLLALIVALSYLDRQAFPTIVKAIEHEIPIGDQVFARLGFVFLIAYATMYMVGGRILDVVGTRFGYAVMIIWWSAANFCSGLVSSVMGLGICRGALGIGEGGGFPASGKAVAEWFPPKERSFAFGLLNAGSSFGAVVAVPILTAVAAHMGWRWVFFLTGSVGCALGVMWWVLYRSPELHPRLADEERAYISEGKTAAAKENIRWLDLFRYPQMWGLMLAKALTDSAWFFLTTWLPRYLANVRGYDLKAIGSVAWIPYACAGVGSFVGGALGTWLIHRGSTVDRSRKICLLVAACIMPATLGIVKVPVAIAIVCFSLGLFAHQFWSSNLQTLSTDLFPARIVGSVMGLMGCAGAAAGGVFQLIAGDLIARHGYALPFVYTGSVYLISFVAILVLVRKVEPVPIRAQA